jgi:hypothetical protein
MGSKSAADEVVAHRPRASDAAGEDSGDAGKEARQSAGVNFSSPLAALRERSPERSEGG